MGCLTMGEVEVSLELNITAANAPSIRVAIAGSIPHIKIRYLHFSKCLCVSPVSNNVFSCLIG